MFGTLTTGDTSGYGGLKVRRPLPLPAQRPYGSYFDELADALATALGGDPEPASAMPSSGSPSSTASSPSTSGASRLPEVAAKLRDDPALAFELCLGVSGVHYPADTGRELHAVYHLVSIRHNRRLRLEVSVARRRPAHPLADGRSTRPATGTSGRPGTSSASSSTGTRH